MRTATYLALLAALLLLVTSCGRDAEPPLPDADRSAQADADRRAQAGEDRSPAIDDDVAALVNGQVLTTAEVDQQIGALADGLEDQETGEETLALLRAQVLSTAIVTLVALQSAEGLGVPVTDSDIAQARAELEEETGGPQALAERLQETGMSEAFLADQLRVLAAMRNIGAALDDPADAGDGPEQRDGPSAAEMLVAERLAVAEVVVNDAYGTWNPDAGQVTPRAAAAATPRTPAP